MIASFWESAATFLTVLTPLVAVPLTVLTFYLRSLREQQLAAHRELVRRIDDLESQTVELRGGLSDVARDFTTKEEWLRECMLARRSIEQLREAAVRMETMMNGYASVLRGSAPEDRPPIRFCPDRARDGAEDGG